MKTTLEETMRFHLKQFAILAVLCLLALVSAQAAVQHNYEPIDPNVQRVVVTADGKAEVQAIPAEVLELRKSDADPVDKAGTANDLALKGYVIDVAMDVWGWQPYKLVQQRRKYGYTWVPSALAPTVTVAPGLSVPGMVSYDPDSPPIGSILVPPPGKVIGDPGVVPPPKPEPKPPQVSPIGIPLGGSRYAVAPLSGDQTPNGGTFVQDGVTFKKVIVQTPFGAAKWWEKQP